MHITYSYSLVSCYIITLPHCFLTDLPFIPIKGKHQQQESSAPDDEDDKVCTLSLSLPPVLPFSSFCLSLVSHFEVLTNCTVYPLIIYLSFSPSLSPSPSPSPSLSPSLSLSFSSPSSSPSPSLSGPHSGVPWSLAVWIRRVPDGRVLQAVRHCETFVHLP